MNRLESELLSVRDAPSAQARIICKAFVHFPPSGVDSSMKRRTNLFDVHYIAPAQNCPTLWRVYDTRGAQPTKAKIVFACANDGSTADHFIDDW